MPFFLDDNATYLGNPPAVAGPTRAVLAPSTRPSSQLFSQGADDPYVVHMSRPPLAVALLAHLLPGAGARADGEPRCEPWCETHQSIWKWKCVWDDCRRCTAFCDDGQVRRSPSPPPEAERKSRLCGDHRCTALSIVGDEYHLNGRPTYEGVEWKGKSMQGLLMNSRMVNAIFDDLNEREADRLWAYQDTGRWDAERNTDEFIAALEAYSEAGLNAVPLVECGASVAG